MARTALDFDGLVSVIRTVDTELAANAVRAVNVSLTLRNWLIGLQVVEYEQQGSDRAQYGERLLEKLELGHGFWFEAWQKRILIGENS